MILNGPSISNWVLENSANSMTRAYVASAYVKEASFMSLLSTLDPKVSEKKIFVRWQADDLLAGSSDLSIYELSIRNGWQLFINQSLHAKCYLFDDSAILGSANLTRNGMSGLPPYGNDELCTEVSDVDAVSSWFADLESNSLRVDDHIFSRIKDYVEEHREEFDSKAFDFLQHPFPLKVSPVKRNFYVKEMLWSNANNLAFYDDDVQHDLSVIGLKSLDDMNQVGARFLSGPVFRWLLELVEEEVYFGELSAHLHNALLDDPAPYRKDVKILLSNLLSWVSVFGKNFFLVDRPNNSQRLKRIY